MNLAQDALYLGLLIGTYFAVRLVDLICRKDTPVVSKVFCVFGIVTILFITARLLLSGFGNPLPIMQ